MATFAHFRRVLKSGEPLDKDTRQGLVDLLTYTEDHLVTMWDILDVPHATLTQRACDKVRGDES